MAESREGTSASVKPKKKNSLLDEEIGMDFFNSWKSMSVADDDTLDFNFDTDSNGKKKFNFDKVDMDFNLDGDFDKLSSFKVDMPDIDFSCPSESPAKTKERTKEDSSGKSRQGKKDHFSISLDFNDDDFESDAQIGSKLIGSSKLHIGDLTDDEPVLLRSERDMNNLSNIREGINYDVRDGSKLAGDSMPQDKQVTQEEPAMQGSEKNTVGDFPDSDVQVASELVCNSKSLSRELTEGEPILLKSENNVKTLGDVREDVDSDGDESKLATDARPQDKQIPKGEHVMPGTEKNIGEDFNINDAQISNKVVGSESLSTRVKSTKSVSLGSEEDVRSPSNMRESINADGVPSSRKDVGNSMLQDKDATAGESVILASEKSSGRKIVGIARLQNKEPTTGEPVTLESKKSSGFLVSPSSSSENTSKSSSEASGNHKSLVSSVLSIQNKKNVSLEGLKTVKTTPDLSSLKNLRTLGMNKETSISTVLKQSNSNIETLSSTVLKQSNTNKETPSSTALKQSNLNKETPSSTVLKQSNSFENSQQNMTLLRNMTSSIAHPIGGTKKQKPLTPSLKRKKIEESNADLVSVKPLKRLSGSPKESRNFEGPSGRVVEEEFCNHENQGQNKTKNLHYDHSTSGLEVSKDVNMTEPEISLVMENDGNVEKAEAYTKALEDICNMLKKKNEEAKELLVRAIVNNNNLLMLNHPMYEEKIRMVQKFATQLRFKEGLK